MPDWTDLDESLVTISLSDFGNVDDLEDDLIFHAIINGVSLVDALNNFDEESLNLYQIYKYTHNAATRTSLGYPDVDVYFPTLTLADIQDAVRDYTNQPTAVVSSWFYSYAEADFFVEQWLYLTFGVIPNWTFIGGGKRVTYLGFQILTNDNRFIDITLRENNAITGAEIRTYTHRIRYQPHKEFVHIKYYAGAQLHYWAYDVSSNRYPSLQTGQINISDTYGIQFFPFIPIAVAYRFLDLWVDTPNYIWDELETGETLEDSQFMLKKLGVGYEDFKGAITHLGDQYIRHAHVGLSLDLNTTSQAAMEYFWEFFEWLRLRGGQWEKSYNTDYITLRFQEMDQQFRHEYIYRDISRTTYTGNFGDVGTFRITVGDSGIYNADNIVRGLDDNRIYLDKQINATQYSRMTISGWNRVVYYMNIPRGDLISPTIQAFIQGMNLNSAEGLYVPVAPYFIEQCSVRNRGFIASEALTLTKQVSTLSRLSTTEREAFQSAMKGLGIIITVLSLGSIDLTAGIDFLLAAGSAAAGLDFASAFIYLVLGTLSLGGSQILIGEIFSSVLSGLDVEVLAVLTVALTGLAGVNALFPGVSKGLPLVTDLMKLVNPLQYAVNNIVTQENQELTEQLNDLNYLLEDRTKMLREAHDLLGDDENIDFFEVVMSSTYWSMFPNPDSFINITTHTPNIGVATNDWIGSYVENSLALPVIS